MRRVFALIALLLLAATAGCQKGKPSHVAGPAAHKVAPPSARSVVAVAYSRTAAAKSARFSFDERGSVNGQPIALTGAGLVDFSSKNLDLALTLPRLGTVRTLKIGPVIYEQLPAAMRVRLGGKSWIKLDLTKSADPRIAALAKQLQGSSQDPTDVLGYLQGLSPDVRTVGTERIRGAQTTHYAATVDVSKATGRLDPQAAAAFRQLMSSAGVGKFPVDIWVDSDNRVRQVASKLPGKGGSELVVTEQFYDFGTPVHVVPPPAADTTDVAGLGHPAGR
ncbi:MAG: hypothetical protein M3042_13245 [Actinomycetota bacterium]|nr:hypothetical protein [Actinomycetota bacterium]